MQYNYLGLLYMSTNSGNQGLNQACLHSLIMLHINAFITRKQLKISLISVLSPLYRPTRETGYPQTWFALSLLSRFLQRQYQRGRLLLYSHTETVTRVKILSRNFCAIKQLHEAKNVQTMRIVQYCLNSACRLQESPVSMKSREIANHGSTSRIAVQKCVLF